MQQINFNLGLMLNIDSTSFSGKGEADHFMFWPTLRPLQLKTGAPALEGIQGGANVERTCPRYVQTDGRTALLSSARLSYFAQT